MRRRSTSYSAVRVARLVVGAAEPGLLAVPVYTQNVSGGSRFMRPGTGFGGHGRNPGVAS